MTNGPTLTNITCVIPVYNDWDSLESLLEEIATLVSATPNYRISVIAVNDGSEEPAPDRLMSILPVKIVNLKVNVGHQRAIAVGIQFVSENITDCDFVVVLDGDGEDPPKHIPILIEKARESANKKIVFAARNRRSESSLFRLGYVAYKYLFFLLTGQKISFGNFSVIPRQLVAKVAVLDNIWNHYSGAILRSRIPHEKVGLNRGKRYKGTSKMNMNALILHGLSSIAIYFDELTLRILRFCIYGVGLCALGISYILYQKMFTTNAIPGWASSLILIIGIIVIQLFSLTLVVTLMQLSARKRVQAPDSELYKSFIADIKT